MASKAAMIRLQKASKTFHEGEMICGTLEIDTGNSEVTHEGITIQLYGQITLARTKMSLSENCITLIDSTVQIVKPGKLPASRDKLSIPFSIKFESQISDLPYTYHGVHINIAYFLKGEVKRRLLAQKIATVPMEIYSESSNKKETTIINGVQQKEFLMNPDTVKIAKARNESPGVAPSFDIRGKLDGTAYKIQDPLTGEICVMNSEKAIKSIEVQLLRMEEIPEENLRQTSEVQNIQVAEGDVVRGLAIPLYMVFPRYFTCPSQGSPAFNVAFEVNICVVFLDSHTVSISFPIDLHG